MMGNFVEEQRLRNSVSLSGHGSPGLLTGARPGGGACWQAPDGLPAWCLPCWPTEPGHGP